MGRYTGPNCKKCRRNGAKLYLKGARCEMAKCAFEKRPSVPGAKSKRLKKLSEYGIRLREKQKLRCYYGVLEKQMRVSFDKASRQSGVTGYNMLLYFEMRLDNIIMRARLAKSRKEARQLVLHGHFTVNGKKVNIPSYQASELDIIKIDEKSFKFLSPRIEIMKEKGIAPWLSFDEAKNDIKIARRPERGEIDTPVDERLIVEFYSR